MTTDMFIRLIMAIASIVGIVISAYVIPFIESKYTREELECLMIYIEKAVRCAEQIYTPEEWLAKKRYVVTYIKNLIGSAIKIDLTDEQIDTLIEGVVNEVKKGA